MKPHPKVRKSLKWAGATVTVFSVVIWFGSVWVWAGWWPRNDWGLGIASGQLWQSSGVVPSKLTQSFYWSISKPPRTLLWSFERKKVNSRLVTNIPLWAPSLVAAMFCATAWRLDAIARRKMMIGRCVKCGYDLSAAAAGAKCPECGN